MSVANLHFQQARARGSMTEVTRAKRDSQASDAFSENGESQLLARVRRGEVALDAYLEFLADEGVKDFAAFSSPERLAMIRELLREQLASDPVLTAMVRRATGRGTSK